MEEQEYRQEIINRLAPLGDVSGEEMMGGMALYNEGFFFGIIFKGQLYFKTNDQTSRDYRARGMGVFAPNERVSLTSFHQVPPDVLRDDSLLVAWAKKSIGTQNG